MGNKTTRLNVFENIVDLYNTYDNFLDNNEGFSHVKEAIKTKNMPFIFMSFTVLNVTLDTNYGTIKLTYNELLKKHQHLFDDNQLTLIRSTSNVMNVSFIPLLKQNYQDICHNMMSINNYNDFFCDSIMNNDADALIVLTKCFGFNIHAYSNIEQDFTIKELFELYQDDKHWSLVYEFMNKNYDYKKINAFLLSTLAIKKELFEMYKLLRLFQCPNKIIDNIINIQMDDGVINDITCVIRVNTILKESSQDANMLTIFFNSVYDMEKYKIFWLWLNNNFIIKDIITFIFDILLHFNEDYSYVKIPLLLI